MRSASAPPLDMSGSGRLGGGRTSLDLTVNAGSGNAIRVTGSAPLSADGALDVKIDGSLDAGLANAAFSAGGRHVSGALTVAMQLRGTVAKPQAQGSIRLTGGAFSDDQTGFKLTAISGVIQANGDAIRIDQLAGATPNAGSIVVSGQVGLDPAAGFPGTLKVTGRHAQVVANDVVTATADLALDVTGRLSETPNISGRITIVSMDITVPDRLDSVASPIPGTRHLNPTPTARARLALRAREQGARARAPLFNATLAVTISAANRIFLHGRGKGEGLLIIYDNATQADALKPFLPKGGAARVLVTSNAPDWRGIAAPIELKLWPKDIGADYLIARTGRAAQRAEAEALSEALGGLPLAHEQAAAYCERLSVSFAEYARRLAATPIKLLDAEKDAPLDYHDKLTVAKTFALAIDEAAKLHPAAEPLIFYAVLLAPEPIPLFLFSEAREKFGEPLASDLAGDGLDEAVAALRAFTLVDREPIPDERDPLVPTGTIRLHRLVRAVATDRFEGEAAEAARRVLIEAMAAVYPRAVYNDPNAWPRARRLDALALDLLAGPNQPPTDMEEGAAYLLDRLAAYRQGALAAYAAARPLFERALTIREKALGPEHPSTATSLNNLALLLNARGDLGGARPLFERALAIDEMALGPEHPDTAQSLNNLAGLLQAQGDLGGARPLFERALAIREKALGPEHRSTATSLDNLAVVLEGQGDLARARPLYKGALAIREKALGPEHPSTARSLNNLASLLKTQGDYQGARPLFERALAINEKALGPKHPSTATSLNNLALLLKAQSDLAGARPLFERALAIDEKVYGLEHPDVATDLNNLAGLLYAQGDLGGARVLYERALAIHEKALGPKHPGTIRVRDNLAALRRAEGARSKR